MLSERPMDWTHRLSIESLEGGLAFYITAGRDIRTNKMTKKDLMSISHDWLSAECRKPRALGPCSYPPGGG